jgi:hypothetical protein
MKDMIKISYRDFSVRKLSLQDCYERNQGLKTSFHIKKKNVYAKEMKRTSGEKI